jgi:hypothetical protein
MEETLLIEPNTVGAASIRSRVIAWAADLDNISDTIVYELEDISPFSCDSTCKLWQFSVLVQVLGEEGSHSLDGSMVVLAEEDAKDLAALAVVALERVVVLGDMRSGILEVDGSDPIQVSKLC